MYSQNAAVEPTRPCWGMPKARPTEKQTHHVIDITISSASIASVKFIAGTRKEQQLLKTGAKYVPVKR